MIAPPVLVWFRRDLRLSDNVALDAAVRSGCPVIPVLVWWPEKEAPWAPGAAGLATKTFPGALLFDPDEIRNQSGEPFRVFTAFWKACLKAPAPDKPKTAPRNIPAPDQWPGSLKLSSLQLQSKIDRMHGMRGAWKPGEQGGAERLRRFLHSAVEDYSNHRDRPDVAGTSRVSPHLHFGEITPRQVWRAARGGTISASDCLA